MTTLGVRALSRRAGALLGAVAVLAAGCAAAGGGSGPRAGRAGTAQYAAAARASSHGFAHRTGRTGGPGSVRHSREARIAGSLPLIQCELAMGHPVVYPVSAAPGSHLVMPACPCCGWCSCAWACCGCGPGWRLPGPWQRAHPAWLCCARWQWPRSEGALIIACMPGCRPFVCPAGSRVPVPGPARATAGFTAGALPGGGSQRYP
jgi:hypothetical protein